MECAILDEGKSGRLATEAAVTATDGTYEDGETTLEVAMTAREIQPPRLPNIPAEVLPLKARQFRLPKTFAALRHRNFQLFVLGQLISSVGTWMQIIAQGWLVYQLSQSELVLGIVGFASALPALFITPWGGVVVDRMPKRTLLIITQTASMIFAFILAALTMADVVQVWHVVALAVGLGVVNAFDGPARQAFVVEMVGRADLPNAIALNSMTFNGARIFGPAIGGILLASVGAGWCFFWNGLTFLAVIIGLWAMDLPPHQASSKKVSPWQQLRSGVTYANSIAEVRALLMMAFIISCFGITYSTVLPAFVAKVLQQDATAFGALNTTAGIGAIITAFLIARYGDQGKRGEWLAVSAIAFPVVLCLFAVNHIYPLALILGVFLGMGFMSQFTLINTLLQTNISDEMRGRVMSLYTLTFFGFTPFGNLAIGAVAEQWGLSEAIVSSALIALVLSIIVLYKTPQLRQLR
ncbi:MAG: MFS transporter [Caldilinea sp. CFX5]|nr:MFS transporter [Caldilinea sp. CFX5]